MNSKIIKLRLLFILLCIPNIAFAQEFKKALPNYELAFPKDHGAHKNYETEWWYFTGLLKTNDSNHYKYGFQLTFFSRANKTNANDWNQAYLAHAAISNFETSHYRYNEKLASAGLGIAGASESELKVWNHNWRAEKIGKKLLLSFDIKDQIENKENNKCELRLISNDIPSNTTRIIKNGDNAYSKKGSSGASIYYSIAPIELDGHIKCKNEKKELDNKELVSGKAWMDHEFMTNALSKDQVGWDWISLNFENNDTLMLFRLRDKNGKANYKSGNYIKNGKNYLLKDFNIQTIASWQSSKTKANYPTKLKIKIPKFNLDFNVSAKIKNQEFVSKKGPSYWEGAISTEDTNTDNRAIGYLEMTGYDKAIKPF